MKYRATYMLACWALLTSLGIAGCGLKGPLYVPDKDHPQQQAPDPNKPSWF